MNSAPAAFSLAGKSALVTAGPTYEAIDPVRYIANRSSGRQGYAIAQALAEAGAKVTLVSGPTALECPKDVQRIMIESAQQMLDASFEALPCDMAIMSAAVADWRVLPSSQKLKKGSHAAPQITLSENPDILAQICAHKQRPKLVIGFAAETQSDPAQLLALGQSKRQKKGCDWLFANDVSLGSQTFGGQRNKGYLITDSGAEAWPEMDKLALAKRLVSAINQHFETLP